MKRLIRWNTCEVLSLRAPTDERLGARENRKDGDSHDEMKLLYSAFA
jgi:hypothetical protein